MSEKEKPKINSMDINMIIIAAIALFVLVILIIVLLRGVSQSEDLATSLPAGDYCVEIESVPVYKEHNSTDCCYPSECSQAVNNPEKCVCIYVVACGPLEELI